MNVKNHTDLDHENETSEEAGTLFADRDEAGELLARNLIQYRREFPVVLAIPRRSLPLAKVIAERLDAELDVIMVGKLGAPENPEFMIGAVNQAGEVSLSPGADNFEIPPEYLLKQAASEAKRLKAQRSIYAGIRPPVEINGRVVIIVDDGSQSGSTFMAAVRFVRKREPSRVIIAAPVISREAYNELSRVAEDVVTLIEPSRPASVSEFFTSYDEISEEVVLRILKDEQCRVIDVRRPDSAPASL